MFPKVVVATLTWNQRSDVLECLSSLIKLDYPYYEIVVIDNGSTDGTFEAVQEQYPQVRIVRHSENLGCAEGVNGEIRAALQACAEYLFIIANDAIVEPSTLKELVEVAQRNPHVGIVNPKVYYYGTDKKIWFARGAKFNWTKGQFYGFVQKKEDDGSYDEETEADYFPGGFSLVRTEAIKKAGFLDPAYFIFFDDSDWSHRIHLAGYPGRYAPKARAWHKPSSSVGMESESFFYYRTRNRFYFVKKHASFWVFLCFLVYFAFEFLFKTSPYLFFNSYYAQFKASLLGVFDFFRGKMGKRDFGSARSGAFQRLKRKMSTPLQTIQRNCRYQIKRRFGKKLWIRVEADWNIGDEIMIIPVYEALKKDYPDLILEARVRHPELLKGNPFVDLVNPSQSDPDRILDLHREVRSRPRYDFLKEISGVSSWGYPKVYMERAEVESVWKKWNLREDVPRIAISPAARWFARQWPRENWNQLVDYFAQNWGAQVFVLGKEDRALEKGIDLMGKTSLRETMALLSQCHLFIGSDSGPVHLAVAMGTPTIGLFGPLNPDYLIRSRAHFFPISADIECRYCWSEHRMSFPDHCPKVAPDCMNSISISQVIKVSEKIIFEKQIKSVPS